MQVIDICLPCSFLALLYAIGEAIVPRPQRRNLLLGAVFLTFALSLLHGWLLLSGRMIAYPFMFEVSLPLIFLLGPLLFAYFRETLLAVPLTQKAILMHLIPATIVVILCLPYFLGPADLKLARLQAFYRGERHLPSALLFPLSVMHAAIYMALTLRDVLGVLRLENLRREGVARSAAIFVGLALVGCMVSLAGILLDRRVLIEISLGIIALNAPLVYLIQRRYPQFLNDLEELVRRERERDRYRRSRLGGVDLPELERRLEQIMQTGRAYTREDLTLPGLAAEARVKSHQLSEYINNHREVNFAGFVNSYRVSEAQRLLLEDRKRTVLSVAFEVGFNSKTAFNDAFTRHAGCSPGQFRKQNPRR